MPAKKIKQKLKQQQQQQHCTVNMPHPNCNFEWHFVLEAISFTMKSVSEKLKNLAQSSWKMYIITNRNFNQFFSAGYVIKRNVVLIFFLKNNFLKLSTSSNMCVTQTLTLGRTRKFIPPPWYRKGGGRGGAGWNRLMEPLPGVFDTLQYFETILPLVESLWSSYQDDVYFMGGGAVGGLWRHQHWSPSWQPSWILSRIRNTVYTARNGNFLCFTWKITHK